MSNKAQVAVFSTHRFDKDFLNLANQAFQLDLHFFETRLTPQTIKLAHGYKIISGFVTDQFNREVIAELAANGTKLIALRSAGFNHVDVKAAKEKGIVVLRVPSYSPYAVAEFAVGLILTLNRKIHRAYQRVREHDFSLDGLMGFDLYGLTVGIIGTGKIGSVFAKIMHGFGCKLLAYDPIKNKLCEQLGVEYVDLKKIYQQSDIISMHCPLTSETKHIINQQALAQMKNQVMLINTGRGALIDTIAVIEALKRNKIGFLGLDVYEEDENLFFENLSDTIIQDDVFARLQTFPNVVITGHQAFFTRNAVANIAETTLRNIAGFLSGEVSKENHVI